MRVTIHESRRKRGVAEIDHLGVSGRGQVASRIDDLVSLNNDDAVLHERVRFSIKQTRRFEDDDFVGSGRGVGENRGRENQEREPEKGREVHRDGIKIFPAQSKTAAQLAVLSRATALIEWADAPTTNACSSLRIDVDRSFGLRANESTEGSLARAEIGSFANAGARDRLRHSLGRKNSDARQGRAQRDDLFSENAGWLGAENAGRIYTDALHFGHV